MEATTDTIATIAGELPAVAAVLVLVVVFLWYLERKDKAFIKFLEEERTERRLNNEKVSAALDSVAAAVSLVHTDLREMDTYLRARLDAMDKARNRRKNDAAQ
jgi:hypothetical protein